MAFQPDENIDGLYYPSSAAPLGARLYDVGALLETPTGSNLYAFETGDFAYPVLNGVPHVELTLFDIDPLCVNVTVYRTVSNRTLPVRGQINVYAVGGRNVVDWEAPFGVPLTYRAEQFDAAGISIGYTSAFSTFLDVKQTWVHNVFDPKSAVPVTMAQQAAGSLQRKVPTDLYWASGSGVAVGISGQRRGLTDVDVTFLTTDIPSADKVDAMFGDPYVSPTVPPVLCIRPGAGMNMRLPTPFYGHIPELNQVPLNLSVGGSLIRWECTATEVAPPAPALVNPVLTYEELDTAYGTYAAMDAAYGSYLERDRDYLLSGSITPGTGTGTGPGTGDGGAVDTSDVYGAGVYGSGVFGD